jgi:signal transduction histidine kinase
MSSRGSRSDLHAAPQPALAQRGLRALTNLSRLTTSRDDVSAIFKKLSALAADVASARRAGFWQVQPNQTLRLQAIAHDIPRRLVGAAGSPPCGPAATSLAGQVVHQGRVFRSDLERDPEAMAAYRREFAVAGAESAVIVPWTVGGERLGALAVYESTREEGFTGDDITALQVVAEAAALIWQQRRLQARLRASQAKEADRVSQHVARLADVERTKKDMLNLAAHELRTPIGILRGYLSMVDEGDIADLTAFKRVLPTLMVKVDQMASVVDQMLATARLDHGQLDLDMEPVDIRRCVHQAADQVALLAGPRHWLLLELGPHPVWVLGDPERLTTVIANLLDNAIKYSPDGGEIRCALGCECGMARVCVTDQGLGIASQDVHRVFTRFGRVVTSENNHISGTGLGLYLCRELARLHGGDVSVRSEPGAGSTFCLTLPMEDVDARTPMPPFGLDDLGLADLIACCKQLRGLPGRTVERRANAIVHHLFDNLVVSSTAEPACALLRLFEIGPYRALPAVQRALVRAGARGGEPAPDSSFVRLLASAGSASSRRDPATGPAASFIPAAMVDVGRRSPILSWVLTEGGAQLRTAVGGRAALDPTGPAGARGLLHVAEARDSRLLPDQDFVRQAGVRSVVGCVETLSQGGVLGFVMFSRVAVEEEVALLLRGVAHSIRLALQAASAGWTGAGPLRRERPR